jgi:hypothetical protein
MSVHDADYSKVKKLLGIPEDEPIFILRAQDKHAPWAVEDYCHSVFTAHRKRLQFETDAASVEQLKAARVWRQRVDECAEAMYEWQEKNEDKVKVPD